MYDVCIVGAGASGIMAAIAAAEEGARVVLVEHMDRIGKKILLTGNGKCNLTNKNMTAESYHGDQAFVASVLQQFSTQELCIWLEKHGIKLVSKRDGYIYPVTEAAASVVKVLLRECRRLSIHIEYEFHVTDISSIRGGFQILDDQSGELKAKKVILACGGKSFPKTGSDGSGYQLLKKTGIRQSRIYPSLTAIVSNLSDLKVISGLRTDAKIQLFCDNQMLCQEMGQVQFTDYGLSGIPVFQISRFVPELLDKKKQLKLRVLLFPDETESEKCERVKQLMTQYHDYALEEVLAGVYPKRWIDYFVKTWKLSKFLSVAELPKPIREKLAVQIQYLDYPVCGYKGFDFCQVCSGGAKTDHFDRNLQCMEQKGIYVVGELLDVDGLCGGYNLQWAFSTGFIAGRHAAKEAKDD